MPDTSKLHFKQVNVANNNSGRDSVLRVTVPFNTLKRPTESLRKLRICFAANGTECKAINTSDIDQACSSSYSSSIIPFAFDTL
mmetsp:Transcript_4808/g.6809  ORF Transcript_4808/g.6809 Transcript_4808/m.6809 type:complete len:84 (-) Transcript_4808:48-299(-)